MKHLCHRVKGLSEKNPLTDGCSTKMWVFYGVVKWWQVSQSVKKSLCWHMNVTQCNISITFIPCTAKMERFKARCDWLPPVFKQGCGGAQNAFVLCSCTFYCCCKGGKGERRQQQQGCGSWKGKKASPLSIATLPPVGPRHHHLLSNSLLFASTV